MIFKSRYIAHVEYIEFCKAKIYYILYYIFSKSLPLYVERLTRDAGIFLFSYTKRDKRISETGYYSSLYWNLDSRRIYLSVHWIFIEGHFIR